MTNIFIDIETIPGQDSYESFLEDAVENFQAPSSLTKAQACTELGLTDKEAKSLSKDDAIAKWVDKFSELKAPQLAEHNWRKTALDGAQGEIVSIATGSLDTPAHAYYRDLGEATERFVILDAFQQIKKLCNPSPVYQGDFDPYFIGHNVQFDLKFLWQRAVILGIKPSFKLPFGGRHNSDFFDNMQAWAGFGQRISQDNLAKALGLPQKPDDIDGSKVWDFVKAGDAKRVAEYNEYDVETVMACYKRMNFIA